MLILEPGEFEIECGGGSSDKGDREGRGVRRWLKRLQAHVFFWRKVDDYTGTYR